MTMNSNSSNYNSKMHLISDLMCPIGASGVRGLVTAFTDDIYYGYPRAFLQTFPRHNLQRVSLAVDLRQSSPRIVKVCMAAIVDCGLQVDYLGALSTPALALYSSIQGQPGLMIAGSHIPFDRNGIKFYKADGENSKQDEALISQQQVSVPESIALQLLPAVNLQPQASRRSVFKSSKLKGSSKFLCYLRLAFERRLLVEWERQVKRQIVTTKFLKRLIGALSPSKVIGDLMFKFYIPTFKLNFEWHQL